MKQIQISKPLALLWAGAFLAPMLAGCQHASAPAAPQEETSADMAHDAIDKAAGSNKLVAHGKNKQLYFKAPQYGRIYLYDADAGQFIYRGFLAAGEAFMFEPASSRATINKQTADLERYTNEHDEYELYFAPQ
ncbi:MAG TPA: hypothetical protein VLJ39_07445 [Tepidisphaeraceae bacterium]|nr:hypothetical protein [Tepidisphaeraceae bacterium]